MPIKPIQILINAKDEASGVFDKLQTKVAAVGAAIAGYFSVKAFVGMVKGAADFEQAMSRVQAATGASGKELEQLRATAEQAGSTTTFSSVQAAGALENLAKAGLNSSEAIKTLPAVLALAQAGDIELGTSAEYVTKAIRGMGLAFDDAGRVADVLAKGANATNTSVDGLAQALSFTAPIAQTLGVSLESTVAILGKMADAGIDASRSGAALNAILAQFSDPLSTFRKELAAAGITTSNFEQALHQLAVAGPRGEKAINAVGLRGGPALRALLNQGMGALDDLTHGLQNAGGSAEETARIMQGNLNGAFKLLSNAWGSLTDTLTTPVLPVLTTGVQRLADAFRTAVSSGIVKRFGDTIAVAFQGAITWATNFAQSIDFDALLGRLQNFASQTEQTFAQIGEYATTAGSIVKFAWGAMATGTDVVMSAIFKVGAAFAGVASNIQSGVALIMTGLSKLTFGDVSKGFADMAESIRISAQATRGVSEELAKKAGAAFDSAAQNAQLVRDGWDGITAAVGGTVGAIDQATASLNKQSVALDAARVAAIKTAAAVRETALAHEEAAKKAETSRAAIADLQHQYQQAIDTGNVQLAAEIMVKLKGATEGAAAAQGQLSANAKDAAAQVVAAFARAGVQTKAELQDLATNAKTDFETIKSSGQATTQGVAEAFKRAADAAIAANNGIAPSWVQAQAGAQGYKVEVDAAGKATLEAAGGKSGIDGLAQSWHGAASAAQSYSTAVDEANAKKYGRAGQSPTLGALKSGELSPTQGVNSWLSIFNLVKSLGTSDADARRIASNYYDQSGKYIGSGNQRFGESVTAAARREADQAVRFGPPSNAPAPTPAPGPMFQPLFGSAEQQVGGTYISNITIPGIGQTSLHLADQASQQNLESLLQRLTAAKGAAA